MYRYSQAACGCVALRRDGHGAALRVGLPRLAPRMTGQGAAIGAVMELDAPVESGAADRTATEQGMFAGVAAPRATGAALRCTRTIVDTDRALSGESDAL